MYTILVICKGNINLKGESVSMIVNEEQAEEIKEFAIKNKELSLEELIEEICSNFDAQNVEEEIIYL